MHLSKIPATIPFAIAVAIILMVSLAITRGGAESYNEHIHGVAHEQNAGRTLNDGQGYPLSAYFKPPQNIQDLVNRHDAIVVGTIAEISNPKLEKPYDWTPQDDAEAKRYGFSGPRILVTYYRIRIEELLLDDGVISAHPRFGLTGQHNQILPQVGERFLFALLRQPDGLSYGLSADWNLIHLDGGSIRNFDGESPNYAGVTNEATLKSALKSAIPLRVGLSIDQWPIWEHWVDETAPAETPAAPGGPAPGGNGPTGNANN